MSVTNASIDSSTSFFYQGRSAKYIPEDRINITVLPSQNYPLVDETEEGLLVGFELATNKPEMLMQIVVYGDNVTTPRVINNLTVDDVLRLGRGLTPGDVEPNPDGRSKDQIGQQDPLYPWIARYKSDELADFTGYSDKFFVLRFTPVIYVPYKRIVINISNKNLTDTATIITLNVLRIVFESKEKIDPANYKPYPDTIDVPDALPGAPINESIYDAPAPIDIINPDTHPDQEAVS